MQTRMDEERFNNHSINVRTRGQGSGPEFQASVDRLHGLNKEPVHILRLVMEEDDPTGISLEEVVPVLDQLYQPVKQLLAEGMHLEQLSRISRIIACTERIKLSRIQGGGMLAVPAADSQSLNIEGAQHIDEIRVAARTKRLSVSDAPNLQAVTAGDDGDSALQELYLDNCPQQQLTTQPFQRLVTLEISNCALQHGVDMHALRAVRKTLRRFVYRGNSGHSSGEYLTLRGFTALRTVKVIACQQVKLLRFIDSPVTTVKVDGCKRFMGVRVGTDQEFGTVQALWALTKLVIQQCRDFQLISIGRMVDLRYLNISGNSHLYYVSIDGDTCPALRSVRLCNNPKLWDSACHLPGAFPGLTDVRVSHNRFKQVPRTWEMEALRTITLCGNRLREPVDLSALHTLKKVHISDVICPVSDRGGQPFQLRVIVSRQAAGVALFGDGLVLVLAGEPIPDARLAPVQLQACEVFAVAPPRVVGFPASSDDEAEEVQDYEGDTADEPGEDEPGEDSE